MVIRYDQHGIVILDLFPACPEGLQCTLLEMQVRGCECLHYAHGLLPAHYPVPAIRNDVVYWDMKGISISVPGEVYPRYTYGRCFGCGIRINYWEP